MVALDVEGLTREIDAVRDVVVVPGARGETTTTTSTAERAGSDDVGRIEAALAGHEGTWHLRVNRLERGKLVAWYAVVYSRPVPVRAQPHIDSAVLGFAAPSARVLGVSLTSDGWLELAGDDASGENVNGSAGWMLTNHPEHGTLLEHASGCELPPTTMRLASAEAVIDVDHTALPLRNEGYLYRVAHGPFVPVRASASVKSEIIGRMHEDRLVRARAPRGLDRAARGRRRGMDADAASRVWATTEAMQRGRERYYSRYVGVILAPHIVMSTQYVLPLNFPRSR